MLYAFGKSVRPGDLITTGIHDFEYYGLLFLSVHSLVDLLTVTLLTTIIQFNFAKNMRLHMRTMENQAHHQYKCAL